MPERVAAYALAAGWAHLDSVPARLVYRSRPEQRSQVSMELLVVAWISACLGNALRESLPLPDERFAWWAHNEITWYRLRLCNEVRPGWAR